MPVRHLHLAPTLTLPFDAVTQKIAWVGNSGSGKTYGAKVMAEEMLRSRAQIVVLDPVDAWYGLRYGRAKGKSGLAVYVFGGSHGDAPLEPTAGRLLADVVVETGISAVFSMRHLPKAKQRQFVADFCEQLYLRKGEDRYRTALHVFVEEAHQFAPQNIVKTEGEASRSLGAIIDIVALGRGSGLGVSLISQRVQGVSKAVLELVEVMVAFRTTGPLARKKFKEWFDEQDAEDGSLPEFLAHVTKLRNGHAWVWSPSFLGLFEEIAIRRAETFDSSATPEGGKVRSRPAGSAAKLDLDRLGDRIRETVERVEANDPKKLQARIKELEREVAKLNARPAGTKVEEIIKIERVVEREVVEIVPSAVATLLDALAEQDEHTSKIRGLARALRGYKPKRHKPEVISSVTAPRGYVEVAKPMPAPKQGTATPHPPTRPDPTRVVMSDGTSPPLDKMKRKILSVLVQFPEGRTRPQLTMLSGYTYSGGFRNALGALRTYNYMTGLNGEVMQITSQGTAALGDDWEPLPSGEDLFEWWMNEHLKGMERDMVRHVRSIHPNEITGEDLAAAIGKSYSGGFRNSLGRLRTLELLQGGNTTGMTLNDDFAEAIA